MQTPHESHKRNIDTRLRGRWLLLAKAAWIIGALVTIGLFAASIPFAYMQYQTVRQAACTLPTSVCLSQPTSDDAQILSTMGLSLRFYAAYIIALKLMVATGYIIVAFVIFWRKSTDWIALFVAFTLMIFGTATAPETMYMLAAVRPVWQLPVAFMNFLGVASFGLFLYLFPSGRFVPRWTRWIAVAWVVWEALANLLPNSPFDARTGSLSAGLVFIGFIGTMLFAQIYRYRRVSDGVQRQQTKWVVFGITALLGMLLGSIIFGIAFPSLYRRSALGLEFIYELAGLLIPLSIGIAILRYRLFDIDVIINRTLVYGVLTAALAFVYIVSVVLLRQLLAPLTGGSELAIVASTLAIAALFTPLRRRIQNTIDKRFYRRKYDAAKVLAAFAATARDETDLDALTAELLRVVDETMQPEFVGLWLRESERNREEMNVGRQLR